jgi:hypothetical protein
MSDYPKHIASEIDKAKSKLAPLQHYVRQLEETARVVREQIKPALELYSTVRPFVELASRNRALLEDFQKLRPVVREQIKPALELYSTVRPFVELASRNRALLEDFQKLRPSVVASQEVLRTQREPFPRSFEPTSSCSASSLRWVGRALREPGQDKAKPADSAAISTSTNPIHERRGGQESGIPQNAKTPTELVPILPVLLSAADIAKVLRQPKERVESFLRRFRKSNPDCCIEIGNPRRNEPRIFYRTADVWPALQEQLRKWEQLPDPDEREAS